MTAQRTDQPSNVSTEEAVRPRDSDVVTSDAPAEEPRDDQASKAAAPESGSSTDSDSATDETKKQTPTRNPAAERRIRKLKGRLTASEQREAENARKIAELEETVQSLKTAKPKAREPMLADFANPREYAKAYAKWETSNEEPAPKPRTAKPATPPAAKPSQAPPPDKEILDFQERGKKKLGDEFVEALETDGTAVSQVMGEFMIDSDVGPELYVYLSENQDVSRKIFDSSAPRAMKQLEELAKKAANGELLKAEGELDVAPQYGEEDDEEPAPPPRKRTKAPTPPSDVKPGGDASTKQDPNSESMDDYAARRAKEERRRMGLPN